MMNKSKMSFMLGILLSAGGALLAMEAYKMRQKEAGQVLEDTDMRNSKKIDRAESVNAQTDPEEKGLTQLDSAYRAEWVANGFPQTRDQEELEGYEVKVNKPEK